MHYYLLYNLGKSDKEKYCFVCGAHNGVQDTKLVLKYGGSLKGIYPEDPYAVKMFLDEDHPKHIKKGDYISTTQNYVMVSIGVVEEIEKHNVGKIEFWPFTLINHKGLVHSKDYRFVVPMSFDALDEEKSIISRDANNVALRCRKVVLSTKKLEKAPDIFRINDIRLMAFSEPLAEILEKKFTNFVFDKAEQA